MNYSRTIREPAEDRPIDALLAGYAARTLVSPLAALAAAHLDLKPDNRAYVAALFDNELYNVAEGGEARGRYQNFGILYPKAQERVVLEGRLA